MAYVLMTRKTEAAYSSVFERIKQLVPGITPINIVTDYETGLTNVLGNVFREATLKKCWFHMTQVR